MKSTIQYSTTVEVRIDSTTNLRFNLPDDDILRAKRITGIGLRRRNGANGRTYTNRPIISDDAIADGHLTIECDNVKIIDNLPLEVLAINSGDRDVWPVDLEGITPTKSYVSFAQAANIAAGQSVELIFFYEDV